MTADAKMTIKTSRTMALDVSIVVSVGVAGLTDAYDRQGFLHFLLCHGEETGVRKLVEGPAFVRCSRELEPMRELLAVECDLSNSKDGSPVCLTSSVVHSSSRPAYAVCA